MKGPVNFRLFSTIADQVIRGVGVSRTAGLNLARKTFTTGDGDRITAIEQNPKTNSEWAHLARSGHKVVQFKEGNDYVAVSVDGRITQYRNDKA